LTLILLITCSMILSQAVEMDQTKAKKLILDSFMNRSAKDLFKAWHLIFKREYTYASDEAKLRFKIFKENLAKINEHNSQEQSYKVGLNQFSDMTNQEFKDKFVRYRPSQSVEKYLNKWQQGGASFLPVEDDDDDDLTKRNLQQAAINYQANFNAPRNQLSCGGCWAFSITGVIEAAKSIKQGSVNTYSSVQQMLDCNTQNFGCNGGDLITGMNYALNNGIENDSAYTYLGYSGSPCYYSASKATNKISGYQYCSNLTTNYKCSTSIVYSLLQKGPLSVVTNGGSWAFQNYAGGLFNAACSTIDHGVILAGYGISGSTQYWLVRNSWGSSWGEGGYIRIVINPSNNYSCYIEYEAILPIV